MFFTIELQTSGVYLLSQGQCLFVPSEPLIRTREIAPRCEQVVFRCANAPTRRSLIDSRAGFSKEPSPEFPDGTSDAIVLDLWSAVNAHVVVHFVCGGLMIPRELSRSCSLGSELSLSGRKPTRFRAAARRVIAEKRLSTVDSDPSGSRKED